MPSEATSHARAKVGKVVVGESPPPRVLTSTQNACHEPSGVYAARICECRRPMHKLQRVSNQEAIHQKLIPRRCISGVSLSLSLSIAQCAMKAIAPMSNTSSCGCRKANWLWPRSLYELEAQGCHARQHVTPLESLGAARLRLHA